MRDLPSGGIVVFLQPDGLAKSSYPLSWRGGSRRFYLLCERTLALAPAAAGDTIAGAIANAREAIWEHLETLAHLGCRLDLKASDIGELRANEDYTGAMWAVVDIDLSKLSPPLDLTPERVNISLPRYVLNKIDAHTASRNERRSSFLARAALTVIDRENAAERSHIPK